MQFLSWQRRVGILFVCLLVSTKARLLGAGINEGVGMQLENAVTEAVDLEDLARQLETSSLKSLSNAQKAEIKSRINALLEKSNVAPVDLVEAMDDSHEAEVKGAKLHRILGSALYGFFDGLFHGALSEGLEFINNDGLSKVGKGIKDLPNKLNLKRAFMAPKCGKGTWHHKSLKRVGRHTGYFVGNLTKIIKKHIHGSCCTIMGKTYHMLYGNSFDNL